MSAREISAIAWAVALCVTVVPAAGAQQRPTASPHGRLPDSLDCTACHTAGGWTPVKRPLDFDHNRATDFALTGRHRAVPCRSCHLHLQFDQPHVADRDCAVCHADVHQGRITAECATCHVTTSFREIAGRELHLRTGFPLTGAHLQIPCEACHVDAQAGAFTPLDSRCYACHERDFQSAISVDHVAANFSVQCDQCHTTVAFTHNVAFDHASVASGYPLVGAHARIRCASCHGGAVQQVLFSPSGPNDCIACHQDDFQRAHNGAFPTDCTMCHGQDRWEGASFDHSLVAPSFPLVGAHRTLDCNACHLPGSFDLRAQPTDANDCYACHEADYQREHAGTGFPTTCLSCHTQDGWGGAEFADHDAQFFPIYSGAHQGRWSTCTDCHPTASTWTAFVCTTCHTQGATDSRHRDVRNYLYESTACYSCHRNGRAGD